MYCSEIESRCFRFGLKRDGQGVISLAYFGLK